MRLPEASAYWQYLSPDQVAQRMLAVELAPMLLNALPNPYDPSSAIAATDAPAQQVMPFAGCRSQAWH